MDPDLDSDPNSDSIRIRNTAFTKMSECYCNYYAVKCLPWGQPCPWPAGSRALHSGQSPARSPSPLQPAARILSYRTYFSTGMKIIFILYRKCRSPLQPAARILPQTTYFSTGMKIIFILYRKWRSPLQPAARIMPQTTYFSTGMKIIFILHWKCFSSSRFSIIFRYVQVVNIVLSNTVKATSL